MRTMFLVTMATLALGGPALAAEGSASGGFSPPPSPFVTWQQEGATGKHLRPLSRLMRPAPTGAQNAYAMNRNAASQGHVGGPNAHAPSAGG